MNQVPLPKAPRITSVATAVPGFRISQAQLKEICRAHFRSLPRIERLLEIVDHAGVEFRHLCFPPDYYLTPRDFHQRNQDFLGQAIALGSEATLEALGGETVASIDHVIYATTTGVITPSLEAHLYNHLGLRPDIRRTPLFGIGCAGGVNALAHARDFALAHPQSRILVLSVELCGQTFDKDDNSTKNIVSISLFGDGVAAILVDGADRAKGGPQIISTHSELIDASLNVMGWSLNDSGLELILSPKVDNYVREHLPRIVGRFLERNELDQRDIRYFIFHPGGPKIMRAYQEVFQLHPDELRFSRHVLRCYGNISSASVLYVLKGVMEHAGTREGELGLLAAMGPGFAAELALVRF